MNTPSFFSKSRGLVRSAQLRTAQSCMLTLKRASLSAIAAAALASSAQAGAADPGTLEDFSSSTCSVQTFTVTGTLRTDPGGGSVWGTDVYTDDSDLSTAAVHAGVLAPGQTGVVQVQIAAGVTEYAASTRNGVTSRTWGNWPKAFSFVGAASGGSTCNDTTPSAASVGVQTTATMSAINTNIAARFGQGSGFSASQNSIFVSSRGLDAAANALGEPELNAWVALEGRRFSGDATGDNTNLTFGVDRLVNPDLVVGGYVGMNDQTLTASGQKTETQSPLIGAYAAHKLNDKFFFSGFVGYGRPKYSVGATEYHSTRKMLGLSLNGSYAAHGVVIKPDMSVLASQEDIPSSAAGAADQLNDMQAKLSVRVEPTERLANGILPYASLAADYRRMSSNLNAVEDFTKPRFGIGFDWAMETATLRVDIDYGTVSTGVNDLGAKLTYDFRF